MTPFEKAARAHATSRGSKGTLALYEADLTRWLTWCKKHKCDPTKPTLDRAARFRDELLTSLGRGTVRRILTALSAMYEAALDNEKPLASWNPFRRLPRPPADSFGATEPFTNEEALALLRAAEAETRPEKANPYLATRDVAILWLLYQTGLRISSVLGLRSTQLRWLRTYGATADVLGATAHVIGKGNKKLEVEIPTESARAIDRWMRIRICRLSGLGFLLPPDYLIFGDISTKAINKRMLIYGEIANVKHPHPHRFRATYITSALDAGIPLHAVQAAVHHADPKTTLRYDRKERGSGVSEAVAKFRRGDKDGADG